MNVGRTESIRITLEVAKRTEYILGEFGKPALLAKDFAVEGKYFKDILMNSLIWSIIKLAKGGAAMNIATATATEMQNNFGRYLNLVMSGHEIIVTKNGREVGRFIPKDAAVSYLTDSLTGILKGDYDLDEIKTERLTEKYGSVD